jgi:ubiquinol-cytochrome c reductase iron-sulfur subunit
MNGRSGRRNAEEAVWLGIFRTCRELFRRPYHFQSRHGEEAVKDILTIPEINLAAAPLGCGNVGVRRTFLRDDCSKPAAPTVCQRPVPRRDFLVLVASGMTAVGAASALWPFIDSLNPAADALAAGAPIDVDISPIQPGQQITVLWQSKPVFIVNRTAAELKTLQDPKLLADLRDPSSQMLQQAPYAANWHRSIKSEYLVLVGICTHLGCIPKFTPGSGGTLGASWQGGYFCPFTGRDMIWPGVSSKACRRITYRCRLTCLSPIRCSGSARTRLPSNLSSLRSSRSRARRLDKVERDSGVGTTPPRYTRRTSRIASTGGPMVQTQPEANLYRCDKILVAPRQRIMNEALESRSEDIKFHQLSLSRFIKPY